MAPSSTLSKEHSYINDELLGYHFVEHMAAVVSSRLVFLSAICTLIAPATANWPTFLRQNCSDKQGNYTSDSSYKGNLNLVLSILSNNTEIEFGFYFSYYGKNHDKVYAIGLCRGDFKPDVCPMSPKIISRYSVVSVRRKQ